MLRDYIGPDKKCHVRGWVKGTAAALAAVLAAVTIGVVLKAPKTVEAAELQPEVRNINLGTMGLNEPDVPADEDVDGAQEGELAVTVTKEKKIEATEYPSPNDLSEEERELLPYYHHGWTLYHYQPYIYKVYYLGKEIKDISFEINGSKRTTTGGYAVTDNRQLFTVCENMENGTRYHCIVKYDLNTDECKELNSISYLENISKLGDFVSIVSQGNNVYIVFKKYVSEKNYTLNVLKYDEKEDTFRSINSITTVPSRIDWLVYNTENNMWTSIGWTGQSYASTRSFIDFDFENGKYVVRDDYDFEEYHLGDSAKFSLYMTQKGIRYYWHEFSVLNEKTGTYDKYDSLIKYDVSTKKETELLRKKCSQTHGAFETITHKGLIINATFDHQVFNENKGDYRAIYMSAWSFNDLWNYYNNSYGSSARPLYEASDAKVTETNSTYTDRITLKWQAVDGATGYNVYVNNQKINASLITDNTYTIKGLNKETSYDICVTTVNAVGESEGASDVKIKTGSIMLGDINNDQKVNIVDAMQIFHYVSGRNKKVNVTTTNSDINGDGKITIVDAMKIFHYASGRSQEY